MARRANGGGIGIDGYFDQVGGSNGIGGPSSAVAIGGLSEILHPVSKFDTLAGVAIKYGVEVADIKRINGLVSDVQMFAMKTLQIPPGRHPPSPVQQSSSFDAQGASCSETSSSRRRHYDLLDTFQSLKSMSPTQQGVSLCTSILQDNGFKLADQTNGETYYMQDGPLAKSSTQKPPAGLHRKCKSEANGFKLGDSDTSGKESGKGIKDGDSDKGMKKLPVRRRQKSETDFSTLAPQTSAKEENSSEDAAGAGQPNPIPIGLGESIIANIVSGIRKSSSLSSLQESENGTLMSLWQSSKWSLTPDLNTLSTASITRPILDGITNPISGRKNKAAVD